MNHTTLSISAILCRARVRGQSHRLVLAPANSYPPFVLHTPEDPIAALATPPAPSALAVIRVSGPGSLALLSPLLDGGPDLEDAAGHTTHLRTIRDGEEHVDQVVVAVYRAPSSYTGEDGAEICCHGSMPVIQRVLALLSRAGFRPAGPGEFTQRAFLNGRMDLTRAEAVNEIVRARTDKARGLALQRMTGAIERQVRAARDLLIEVRAALEVGIDYPEEEVEAGSSERPPAEQALERAVAVLEALGRTYRRGRIFQEGITVAIAGATNSGKSSFFNLLLRQERAIVSEIHGTTRDYLEGQVSVEGIPVRLFDTAGIRESADPLEQEGMRRAGAVVRAADIVVYLVDSQAGLAPGDERFLSGIASPVIRVWNKVDLPGPACPAGFIGVSAVTGAGIEDLERAVAAAALAGTSGEAGEPLIDSARQRDLIDRALQSLSRFRSERAEGVPPDILAVDLAEALDALGEITGEVTSAEILERMFSTFCVGK
jgi:tRNA modification GTPase